MNGKEYVILIDGKPNRYYKDGQIKTYKTRENAVKEAKKLSGRYAKVEVGKFSAIELEEVKEDVK
ncbi:hypothetical protein [Brevibacillus reuszeri]|uniref:hypothetical protein n=1 Tax=Brevibacillus reuszeri TaxID=54915 RepID=UPI000CCC0942|nr:hypothetical protein [Brevibacillus reuszeri]